jgi:hypothetical protein
MANDYTTCNTCHRSVMASDVDEWGNCEYCRSAPAAPSPKPDKAEPAKKDAK